MSDETLLLTTETRDVVDRLAVDLAAAGYAVERSKDGRLAGRTRFGSPPRDDAAPRVGLPLARPPRPRAADVSTLCAHDVPLELWATVAPQRSLRELTRTLRALGYTARDPKPSGSHTYRLWVSTPELVARRPELELLERMHERQRAARGSLATALATLGEAESDQERLDLGRMVVRVHGLTRAGLTRSLRHADRQTRLHAVAALRTLQPLWGGRAEEPWTQSVARARRQLPPDLVETTADLLLEFNQSPLEASLQAAGLGPLAELTLETWSPARRTPRTDTLPRTRAAQLLRQALSRLPFPGAAEAMSLDVALGTASAAILDPSARPTELGAEALQRRATVRALTKSLLDLDDDEVVLAAVYERLRQPPHPTPHEAFGLELHRAFAHIELVGLALVRHHVLHHAPERTVAEVVALGPEELRALAARAVPAPLAAAPDRASRPSSPRPRGPTP